MGRWCFSVIDKEFEQDLQKVRGQIQNCVAIYSQELERRHGRSRIDTIGLADALCTLNRDFFNPSVRDYCRERGVLIASDLEFLSLLRSHEPNAS